MLLVKRIFLLLIYVSSSDIILCASFPILPEFQVYHNLGNRGSNYTTGAFGVSINLYNEESGLGRNLHLLQLSIPKKTFGSRSRVSDVFLTEDGYGFELGVHDQWENPLGKGATLSIRKIKWMKVSKGDSVIGDGISEVLHLGWSWISGKPNFLVWLMGLDIASINLPHDKIIELEIGLGVRTLF